LQGGSGSLKSKANSGSIFILYVITRIAQDFKDKSAAARIVTPVQSRHVFAGGVMNAVRLNILIVEDNLVNQKVLSK
jgi:Ni,Fe-hydrogenase I cytochrome b subunit